MDSLYEWYHEKEQVLKKELHRRDKFMSDALWCGQDHHASFTDVEVPEELQVGFHNTKGMELISAMVTRRNDWIQENITGRVYTMNHNQYSFSNRDDAILFKLWLSA